MGTHEISAVFPLNSTDRSLISKLSDLVHDERGIYANLRTRELFLLSGNSVSERKAERLAGEFEPGSGSRVGCKVQVYAEKDVTYRTVQVTLPADESTEMGRVRGERLEQVLAKVRLETGEEVANVWTESIKSLKVSAEVTVPKEKTETRYFVVTGTKVDFSGPGYESQAAARAAAVEYASRLDVPHYAAQEVNVIAVTRRVSGAPLVTVRRKVAKREATYNVEIATVRPGAKPEFWFVQGWYHS